MNELYIIAIDGGDNAEFTIVASFDTLEALDKALEKTNYYRSDKQHPNVKPGFWKLSSRDNSPNFIDRWVERVPRNSFYGWYQGKEYRL